MASRRYGAESDPIEFVPGDFAYNNRVASLLGPSWAVMLMYGGKTTTGVLVVGLLVAYMFDLTNVREGSLIVIWVTMLGVGLALFILTALILSNNFYLLFLLGVMDVLVFLTGAWATLQFRWLQRDSPSICLVLEKLLMGCLSIPASIVLTWASISAYGFDAAPFFLAVYSFAGIALCGVPLQSSFLTPEAKPLHGGEGPAVVVERTESQILIGWLLAAPCSLHVALHYSVLFEPGLGNVSTTFALLALPVLLLRSLSGRQHNITWCFGSIANAERRAVAMNVVAAGAGAVVLYVIEMKIIFVSFAHYILLPEPLATLAVTAGLYGGVGTLFCVLTGALKNPILLSAITTTAGVSVSLALGMPLVLLWAPVVASLGFVRFYTTKKFGPYAVFVIGMLCCVAWLSHNLLFLEFSFRGALPLALSSFSLATEMLFGMCLLLPGLALTNVSPGVTGIVLMGHAVGLCTLETVLYWQGEGMYPSALLALTAGLGFLLANRLERDKRIMPTVAWVLRCVYLSKSAVVVVADVWAYPSALFVVLCVSPLLMPAADDTQRVSRMSSGKGLFHAVSIGVALVTTRHILLANLLPPLLGSEAELSEATLLGAAVVATAAATAPLPKTHFRNRRGLRQLHTFTLIVGILMLAISPEVLEGESIATSAFHALTDAAGGPPPPPTIFGSNGNRSAAGRWTSWLLLIALSLSAAVVTQLLPLPKSLLARVIASAGIGGSLGLWLCGSFLPPSPSIFALIAMACILALSYATFTRYPTATSHTVMPLNFGIFTALFPVTYLWQAEIYMQQGGVHAKEHFLRHRTALVGLYAALMFLLALSSKINLSAHSSAARAELDRRRRGRGGGGGADKDKQKALLSVQLDYLPVCGNAATVLCYLLCLLLNLRYLDGSLYSVFFLAPLMLLLSPGKTLFRHLNEANRYAPVADAVIFTCLLGAVAELTSLWGSDSEVILDLEREAGEAVDPTWVLAKNTVLFLVTLATVLPMHDTLWATTPQTIAGRRGGGGAISEAAQYPELYWMIVAPCNMLPGVYADCTAPYILGWFGFAGGLVMWYYANDAHQRGLAVI